MKNTANLSIRVIIVISVLSFFCNCNDKEKNVPFGDFVGEFNWTQWKEGAGWDSYDADDYTPDQEIIEEMMTYIENPADYEYIIYSANWCKKDCATQLPRIIKFLVAAGIPENDILIIGLCSKKLKPENWIENFNNWFTEPNDRLFVPTLVIIRNNEPLGYVVCESSDFPLWQNAILGLFSN